MNIAKYQSNAFTPANRFKTVFDDFFNRNLADYFGNEMTISTPSVNVVEENDHFRIEVAAPGLEKQDFEVSVDKGYLNISAKRENQSENTEEKYTRREFNYTSFQRSFHLLEHVNATDIAANYNNGVLSITLPKREAAKTTAVRAIEIK